MAKPDYEVNITPTDNGIMIRIGCKSLVFNKEAMPEAITDLHIYLKGGHKTQRELYKKYFPEEITEEIREQTESALPTHWLEQPVNK